MMKYLSVDSQSTPLYVSDIVFVPIWEEDEDYASALPKALREAFVDCERTARSEGFLGKWQQTVMLRSEWFPSSEVRGRSTAGRSSSAPRSRMQEAHQQISVMQRVVFYGAGKKSQWTLERARRMVGSSAQMAQKLKLSRLAIACDGMLNISKKREGRASSTEALYSAHELGQALIEAALLATYNYAPHKTDPEAQKISLLEIAAIASKHHHAEINQGLATGSVYARATMHARDLINSPANHMNPSVLLRKAQACVSSSISVKGYNRAAMKKLGMGALLAVASGSAQEPYLIHLRYSPKQRKAKMKIALCAKGITFDSGGLQVKPGQHMDGMKYDMAAAGVVIGIFSVLQQLQPDIEFHGVIAATENMPSGTAMKPGDVVTSYNGKTIEIGHTDAEGRLVLADALAWAEDTIKPDVIMDAATLTGSAIYALGQEYAAYMGADTPLLECVARAASAAGENLWQLPLVEDYVQFVDSKIADVNNLPPVNWAGTSMGGLFLQKFINHTPWVHIDMAGPSWVERQVKSYHPEGATGFGVRTFLHMLAMFSGKRWPLQ